MPAFLTRAARTAKRLRLSGEESAAPDAPSATPAFVRTPTAKPRDDTTVRRSFPPADQVPIGHYELSTHLLALAVMQRGHTVNWVHRSLFTFGVGTEKVAFWCTRCTAISSVAAKATIRKDVAASMMRAEGISVAEGRAFRRTATESATTYARKLLPDPIVVKPADGTKGNGITVDVTSEKELARAWSLATQAQPKLILIERMFPGREARFLVVGDRVPAVAARIPPNVVGDGHNTVQALIDAKNERRAGNPHLRTRPISMDPHRTDYLARSSYTLDSVIPRGEQVFLDSKGGFSSGADSIDLTDEVHPGFFEAAVAAAAAFPGLGVAGVDIMAKDFSKPATPDNYIVVELNSMPGLGSHHFPEVGEPRDAAGAIVDYCIDQARVRRDELSR